MTLLLILVYYGLFCAWITGNLVKPQNVHRPFPQPLPISVLIVLIDWNAFLCINLSGEIHAAAAAAVYST